MPWFHIVILITGLSDPVLRDWYAREAFQQSWPRDTLKIQIKNQLHLRQGAAITNFQRQLPGPQAELATQILKDPYHFDFLGLGDEAPERRQPVCSHPLIPARAKTGIFDNEL